MKRVIFITLFTANLPLFAMACDFHDGEYFSRYDWPRVSLSKSSTSETETEAANTKSTLAGNSKRQQPDFRYTRAKSPANSENEPD